MARVAVLGCGKMGAGFARRLCETSQPVVVWNRSNEKSDAIAAEWPEMATSVRSCAEACAAVGSGGLVIAMLNDMAAVHRVLFDDAETRNALQGRVLANVVSGNPDEGRAAYERSHEARVAGYLDGAYSGSPAKARAGAGQLFLSSGDGGDALVRAHQPALDALGTVTFCGTVGASRALDYAVVDLYLMNYLSFTANLAMLERERVDLSLLYPNVGARLAQVPAFLEAAAARMESRDEAAYRANPGATVGTWRNFWASRLPYLDAHELPAQLPRFVVGLLDEAAGGAGGPHADADMTRLQEVVRYGSKRKAEGAAADVNGSKAPKRA
jgi:3-hydroxyisobutyrate dehydrogenase-like beta-hydroxyacid dehydrogenase